MNIEALDNLSNKLAAIEIRCLFFIMTLFKVL